MKLVGHTDYKTTADIYTHVVDEMLWEATVNMGEVFGKRAAEGQQKTGCLRYFCREAICAKRRFKRYAVRTEPYRYALFIRESGRIAAKTK